MNSIALEAKRRVSMIDVCERYGILLNHAGFAKCPFHDERTASFKVFQNERGYYCFGCGAHGDVITFVREYFGLGFYKALEKLDDDFSLRLPMARNPDHERDDYYKSIQAFKRRRELERQQLKIASMEQDYENALTRYVEADKEYLRLIPDKADRTVTEEFAEAVKLLSYRKYELDMAEVRLYGEKTKIRESRTRSQRC